jgi:hypothetical protein
MLFEVGVSTRSTNQTSGADVSVGSNESKDSKIFSPLPAETGTEEVKLPARISLARARGWPGVCPYDTTIIANQHAGRAATSIQSRSSDRTSLQHVFMKEIAHHPQITAPALLVCHACGCNRTGFSLLRFIVLFVLSSVSLSQPPTTAFIKRIIILDL